MGTVLIVYTTRSEETKAIADIIGEGIRISGHNAEVKRVNEIKSEEDLKGFDAYIFGSPTYHGEMITPMKQLLFLGGTGRVEWKTGRIIRCLWLER